jgi:hypothetical protein
VSHCFDNGSRHRFRPKRMTRMARPTVVAAGRLTVPLSEDETNGANFTRTSAVLLVYPAADLNHARRQDLYRWCERRAVLLSAVETHSDTRGNECPACWRAFGPAEALSALTQTDFVRHSEQDAPVRVSFATGAGPEKIRASGPPRHFQRPAHKLPAVRPPAPPEPPPDWYALVAAAAQRWRRDFGGDAY